MGGVTPPVHKRDDFVPAGAPAGIFGAASVVTPQPLVPQGNSRRKDVARH
jgi:hypothetical protein